MVTDQIPLDMVRSGEALVRALDHLQVRVTAALWMRDADSGAWRLVIATPEVRLHGVRRAYRTVLSALRKCTDTQLTLSDISVVDSRDPLVRRLTSAVTTGVDIANIRFVGNTIQGEAFPDSFIYRALAPQSDRARSAKRAGAAT